MARRRQQLELMGRFMVELGLTPSARTRVQVQPVAPEPIEIKHIILTAVDPDERLAEQKAGEDEWEHTYFRG